MEERKELVRMVKPDVIESPGQLCVQTLAEVDVQVATAQRFPRSLEKFKKECMSLACADEETAESCFYVLRRGGTVIEGPSVRLAEIAASCFKNLRYGSRVIGIDDVFVTVQGFAWDVQNNVAITVETKRRIVKRNKQKYTPDMIAVTANAACSISFRNAVFKVVMPVLLKDVYAEVKKIAIGTAQTIEARRQRAFQKLSKLNITEEMVYKKLGVNGATDITLEHLSQLFGLFTALKEGTSSFAEEFPAPKPKVNGSAGMAGLKDRMTNGTSDKEAPEKV